jgi:shikimate kinase
MNVALFGFMGVGKTVVGKILAQKLGLAFVDIDEEITKKTGKKITTIFEEDGKATFRKIEKSVTSEIAERDHQVIACGGGTILDQDNLNHLRRNSTLILLTAKPEVILERVYSEGDIRPLLMVEEKLDRIQSLLKERNQQYMQAADIVVDTSGRSPSQIAEEISGLLGEEL